MRKTKFLKLQFLHQVRPLPDESKYESSSILHVPHNVGKNPKMGTPTSASPNQCCQRIQELGEEQKQDKLDDSPHLEAECDQETRNYNSKCSNDRDKGGGERMFQEETGGCAKSYTH